MYRNRDTSCGTVEMAPEDRTSQMRIQSEVTGYAR